MFTKVILAAGVAALAIAAPAGAQRDRSDRKAIARAPSDRTCQQRAQKVERRRRPASSARRFSERSVPAG